MATQRSIKVITAERKSVRSRITQVAGTIGDMAKAEAIAWSKDSIEIELATLRRLAESAERLNGELQSHVEFDEGNLEAEMERCESYRETADRARLAAEVMLTRLAKEASPVVLNSTSIAQQADQIRTESPTANPVRVVPSLDIAPEPFAGDTRQFRLFMAQFDELIKRQAGLSDLNKFFVLLRYLRGPARQLVETLEPVDASFTVALQLLRDNYERTDEVRSKLLAKIGALTVVNSKTNIKGLRALVNEVQMVVRSLDGLGVPLSEYAIALAPALKKAVPMDLLFDFQRQRPTPSAARAPSLLGERQQASSIGDVRRPVQEGAQQPPNTTLSFVSTEVSFIDSIYEYLLAYVRVAEESGFKPPDERPTDKRRVHDPGNNSKSTVAKGSSNERPKEERPKSPLSECLFCKGKNHRTSDCRSKIQHDKKVEILRQARRCLRCFNEGHFAKECRKKDVKCSLCNSFRHYASMHIAAKANAGIAGQKVEEAGVTGQKVDGEADAAAVNTAKTGKQTNSQRGVLQIASAFIVSGDKQVPVQVFLDNGSDNSFIDSELMQQFPGCTALYETRMAVEGFVGAPREPQAYSRHKIRLRSTHDNSEVELFVYKFPRFELDVQTPSTKKFRQSIQCFASSHPMADRTIFGELPPSTPRILVGADQYYKLALVGAESAVGNGLVARNTRLGWVLGGVTKKGSGAASFHVTARSYRVGVSCCGVDHDIQQLWQQECSGDPSKESASTPLTADECDAVSQFNAGLIKHGKGYSSVIPKMKSISALRNNKSIALKRLQGKVRGLRKSSHKYARYDQELMAFVQNGHAEEVFDVDQGDKDQIDASYFMPHQQVITERDGKEKWRIVFDCSSHADGESALNDHLLTGPNLNPDLLEGLLRFRLESVAVSADIEKAYLQIEVQEEDRKLFRFFWQGPSDQHIRCFQMTKVTWGARPSGYLLAAVLRHHFESLGEKEVGNSFYHDDFLRSFRNDGEAKEFVVRLIDWLKAAGMSLAKWKSNSPQVIELLRSKGYQIESVSEGPSFLKVLGISWCTRTDTLQIAVEKLDERFRKETTVTKRVLLGLVATIFDPAGWLSPFTVRGKLLVQGIWAEELRWEDEVPRDVAKRLGKWCAEATGLRGITLNRQYGLGSGDGVKRTLHVFADASERAYAAVASIQGSLESQSAVSLVYAKSKLAPLKKITLPRLELLAALLATRVRDFVVEKLGLRFDQIRLYTDSRITYFWCTAENAGRWKTFVANRVREIQAHSEPHEWFFVQGEQNVADLATRGISVEQLRESSAWWNGPSWLSLPESERPTDQPRATRDSTVSGVQAELRAVMCATKSVQPVLDLERFSSLGKAKRTMALILQFAERAKKSSSSTPAERLRAAEIFLVKAEQSAAYAQEIADVMAKDEVRRGSKLSSFNLFIDEQGVLRARTRLGKAPGLTFDEKNPIVIPGESRLAKLLILEVHRINGHFGVNTILSHLRRRFWIVRGRQVIKSILSRCVTCRKLRGSTGEQVQAPLPAYRAELTVPFAVTGLDFCGPFYCRTREGTVKAYIALFTCAGSRAVHLETVLAMDVETVHLALRRFLAQCPGCSRIVTDNFRSFTRAASDIKKLFNQLRRTDVSHFPNGRTLEWDFICPRAPWHGGFYERLVQSVKAALKKVLGRQLVSFDRFRTVVAETAAVINDRPISHVSSDLHELAPLTPSQILRGAATPVPFCVTLPGEPQGGPTASMLRDKVAMKDRTLEHIRRRWYAEYLLQLRSANLDQQRRPRVIAKGDVCILREDSMPRTKWPLVRVIEQHGGRDGRVRRYTVRLPSGNEVHRAAQSLYPLEVV